MEINQEPLKIHDKLTEKLVMYTANICVSLIE